MGIHGIIGRPGAASDLRFDEWIVLSVSHPNLKKIPSKVVPNPFKKGESMTVFPPSGTVAVTISSEDIGSMCWDYDSSQIIVTGSDERISSVAIEIAQQLSAKYIEYSP